MGSFQTPADRAATIMGRNFVGLSELERRFRVRYRPQNGESLQHVNFTEGALRAASSTHVLVPGFPLSIVDLQAKFPRLFFKVGWWRDRPFAQRQVELRWYLVRRLPERSLLSGEYMLPTGEAVYAAILYYLVRGQRLFERVFVLTDDAPLEEGLRARVLFDRDGLRIHMLASSDTGFGGLGHMLRIASAVRTGR